MIKLTFCGAFLISFASAVWTGNDASAGIASLLAVVLIFGWIFEQ